MATKLRLVLKNPQLQLAFKALIFGGFLILFKLGGFSLVPLIFFILVSFLLYSKPIFNTFVFLPSFLILSAASVLVLKNIPESNYSLLVVLFSALLFYLLLGVKNLIFIHRAFWFNFLNLALFYEVFILFFLADKSTFFVLKSLALFFAALILFREFLFVSVPNHPFPKKKTLASWLLAFLVLEIVWAINFLPLGFINSANLAILTVFIFGDLISNYFKATLNRRLILADVTLFVFLLLTIFGTTKWGLK